MAINSNRMEFLRDGFNGDGGVPAPSACEIREAMRINPLAHTGEEGWSEYIIGFVVPVAVHVVHYNLVSFAILIGIAMTTGYFAPDHAALATSLYMLGCWVHKCLVHTGDDPITIIDRTISAPLTRVLIKAKRTVVSTVKSAWSWLKGVFTPEAKVVILAQ